MRGHEAERASRLVVAAARDEDRAEPVQCRPATVPVHVGKERVASAARAIGLERSIVRRGRLLARGKLGSRPAVAERVKERAVGVLRCVREVAREPVEHDRGSAFDDGKRIPPEPQRDPECGRGHGERVQALPR